MYPRTNYEMTDENLQTILDACKPVACIMVGGVAPSSQQENANRAWSNLGKELGFDSDTVQPVHGMSNHFFTAVPSETEAQRNIRVEAKKLKERKVEMETLQSEIEEKTERLTLLRGL